MIKSCFISVLEIILCLYAVIQYIFRKSNITLYLLNYFGIKVILALLCTFMSIASFFALIILLMPLAGYKKTVDAILKRKYKENYGGLLQGIDAMWALENKESRHVINCLLFVNFANPHEEILTLVKKIYKETIVYQFTSIRKRSFGYYYRLKNQVDVEDLIKVLNLSKEEREDKNLFQESLARFANSAMPNNDTACFELLVGVEPVEFCNNDKVNLEKTYPIIMRIHHSVGDGISLLSFLLKNLADEKINVVHEIIKKVKFIEDCPPMTINNFDNKMAQALVKKTKKIVCNFYENLKKISNVNVYHFAPTTTPDRNILRKPKLCGEKILAYYIEENPEYISKIKSIKKRIPGSTFTDVVMTAISASFWEYFKQNSEEIPDKINLSFIIRPIEKNLQYIVSETTGEKEVKLGNNFSVGILGLPIKVDIKDSTTALQERLMKVKNESDKLRNAVDILLYYWQLKFFTNLLPAPVLNLLLDLNQTSTMSFSNLPGIRGVHIRGNRLKDVLFWIPNVGKLGIGLSILTYDDRFQMGLVADKALISNGEKTHGILKNIIKYIDLLDDELNQKSNY